MKRLFFLIAMISFLNVEAALAILGKTILTETDFNRNFVGTINHKIDVVFSLKSKDGKINGFYYYNKIGVEILLTGSINNDGNVVLFELDDHNVKKAKITGQVLKNSFSGTWEDLSTKKTFPIQSQETPKSIPSLPNSLIGTYKFAGESNCRLTIQISKSKGSYYYNYKSTVRTLKGKVTFSRSLDENLVYINFNGIQWEENKGKISDDDLDAEPTETTNLPTYVSGLLSDNEINIQNYGNAINYYVKLGECSDEKFIQLEKI